MARRLDRGRIVYEIRRQIITRLIPAGAAVDENRLADELRVSRTPIREVVHELAGTGLLKRDPASGFRTPIFGLAEILAHLQAMDTLFPAALSLTAQMRRADDLMSLRSALETMEMCAQSDLVIELKTAIRDFLGHCAAATHNETVASVLDMLFDQHVMIRADFFALISEEEQHAQMQENLRLYRQMFRAIEAGDAAAVDASARERVAASRAFIFDQLRVPGGAAPIVAERLRTGT